jgi:hypothetical protein
VNENEIEENQYLAGEIYLTCDERIACETQSASHDKKSGDVHCGDGNHRNNVYCYV